MEGPSSLLVDSQPPARSPTPPSFPKSHIRSDIEAPPWDSANWTSPIPAGPQPLSKDLTPPTPRFRAGPITCPSPLYTAVGPSLFGDGVNRCRTPWFRRSRWAVIRRSSRGSRSCRRGVVQVCFSHMDAPSGRCPTTRLLFRIPVVEASSAIPATAGWAMWPFSGDSSMTGRGIGRPIPRQTLDGVDDGRIRGQHRHLDLGVTLTISTSSMSITARFQKSRSRPYRSSDQLS